MKKGIIRILTLALCMTMLINIMMPAVASAKTINGQEATFTCLTLNDSLRWLFGRTSTVTFKNEGTGWSMLKIEASATGCSVSPRTAYIGEDESVTFTIRTSFGGNGKVLFKVTELFNSNINYSITESGTHMIIRTN